MNADNLFRGTNRSKSEPFTGSVIGLACETPSPSEFIRVYLRFNFSL